MAGGNIGAYIDSGACGRTVSVGHFKRLVRRREKWITDCRSALSPVDHQTGQSVQVLSCDITVDAK